MRKNGIMHRDIRANNIMISKDNTEKVISQLGEVLRCSALEDNIQDTSLVVRCFVKSAYRYWPREEITIKSLKDFYNTTISKKEMLLENIYARLSSIKVEEPRFTDSDLPF